MAAGTNGQEWLLIIYSWIFNHPINLNCDKGFLDRLGKNVTARNLHHHFAVTRMGVYVERCREGIWGWVEMKCLIYWCLFLLMHVTLLCKGGYAGWHIQSKSHFLSTFSMSLLHVYLLLCLLVPLSFLPLSCMCIIFLPTAHTVISFYPPCKHENLS